MITKTMIEREDFEVVASIIKFESGDAQISDMPAIADETGIILVADNITYFICNGKYTELHFSEESEYWKRYKECLYKRCTYYADAMLSVEDKRATMIKLREKSEYERSLENENN